MFKYYFEYECGGRILTSRAQKNAAFDIVSSYENGRLTVDLCPKEKISFKTFKITFDYDFKSSSKIFVNGYQSWTDSREYAVNEKMDLLNIVNEFALKTSINKNTGLGRSGDLFFCKHPKNPGEFYGYSYGYVRLGSCVDLFASLSERSGYTIIRFDVNNKKITVEKDLQGVEYSAKETVVDFVNIKGEYDKVFDRWFELMHIECRQKERMCGYTTWYNYYGNINEEIVERDLNSISKLDDKIDIFQIDDGYQKAIGDWLNTNVARFPNSMKHTADLIHGYNMKAGLWLAPFGATKQSFIYKEHPDWLVKDENGKPVLAGANWGRFYAVDFLNDEAAKYIRHVFDVVLNQWGFDMVKLDFLYAACITPRNNKSRGQLMCEAMDFIRDCVGDKLILGCGVPLMPAFGKVDFCRVGADVCLDWRFNKMGVREDVSTANTVNCTVFRRGLNGRGFMNDPDVFLLRDENTKLTFEQRKLLAQINSVFGSLLFVSDNVANYNELQKQAFSNAVCKKDIKIESAEIVEKDVISAVYYENGVKHQMKFNYKNGKSYI